MLEWERIFIDSFACSKEIFDKANEVLDIDVKKTLFL